MVKDYITQRTLNKMCGCWQLEWIHPLNENAKELNVLNSIKITCVALKDLEMTTIIWAPIPKNQVFKKNYIHWKFKTKVFQK